jgi:hypothetical protein
MAESAKSTASKTKPNTITLTFGTEDQTLYEAILAEAKADRRTPSQSLLLFLLNNFPHTQTEK